MGQEITFVHICVCISSCTHIYTHTHSQHKGSFNDVQAKLQQFHIEVQQGGGSIPINLETPTSLLKWYKADHNRAYVHQAGGGSTLSDVEVRIVVVVNTPLKMLRFYMTTHAMTER